MSDDKRDCGYGRPPKHRQFKPGQSGNPKGRPKGSRNKVVQMLETELNRSFTIGEGDAARRLTAQEIGLERLINAAATGDIASIESVFRVLSEFGSLAPAPEQAGILVARYIPPEKWEAFLSGLGVET